MAQHVLRVSGTALHMPDSGATVEELSTLLTARFGTAAAPATRAVALQDSTTGLVFPLNVVVSRPDFVSQAERLEVLFSFSGETTLLHMLSNKGLLTEQEVRTLTPLTDDPFVSAAFEVYRAEGDEADLVDTLQRIVAIRLGGGSSSPATAKISAATSKSQEQPETAATHKTLQRKLSGAEILEQLSAALKLEEFPHDGLKRVCASLKGKGKLSADDEAVLIQLINKELPHLQAAFEIYLEEPDEAALLNSLKRVARHFGVERVVRGQSYARQILDAFAAGHPLVCGAWDLYVDEHDEEDFRDTLQRCVSRLQGSSSSTTSQAKSAETEKQSRTPSSQADSAVSGKPTEEKNALRRFVLWLHTQGRITSEQGQRLMGLVDAGSPEAEAAMKAYLQSGRSEQEGDVLLNTVLDILERDFPSKNDDEGTEDEEDEGVRLEDMYDDDEVAEGDAEYFEEDDEAEEALRQSLALFIDDLAGDMQMISKSSARKLKVLLEARDARIMAAFDLFSDEKDLNDLVDTLQRLADKVVVVGEDEEEEEEDLGDEIVEHDSESLYDVISSMGLSLTYLEIIRDAMEIRHPEVEHAIDNFAKTQDVEAFKNELVEFCQSQL